MNVQLHRIPSKIFFPATWKMSQHQSHLFFQELSVFVPFGKNA